MSNSITSDLRKKTNDELASIVVKLKAQLLELRFSMANGEAENLHTIKEIKKTIARSLTILNERDIAVSLNKTKLAKKASGAVYSKEDKVSIEAIHALEEEKIVAKNAAKEETSENTTTKNKKEAK